MKDEQAKVIRQRTDDAVTEALVGLLDRQEVAVSVLVACLDVIHQGASIGDLVDAVADASDLSRDYVRECIRERFDMPIDGG